MAHFGDRIGHMGVFLNVTGLLRDAQCG
jgi:hypothetical protein